MTCPISATAWVEVRGFAVRSIADLTERLESPLDPIETARVRGEIKALRKLIAWGEPAENHTIAMSPGY